MPDLPPSAPCPQPLSDTIEDDLRAVPWSRAVLGRRLLTTLLALMLLGAPGLVGARVWASSQPDESVAWVDYRRSAGGLVVRVDTFCRVEDRPPQVEETRGRVVVTAMVESVDPWDVLGSCPADADRPGVEVPLARKLGRRTVYDGHCIASPGPDDRCVRGARPRGQGRGTR